MYEELVTALQRYADDSEHRGCAEECKYGKEHPVNYVCIPAMMKQAANAIEKLDKYANTIMRLKNERWYLQQAKYQDGYTAIATMQLPEPPKEEIQNIKNMARGKWKHGVCSECGYDWSNDAPIANVPNFCPNCGADMRKEGKGKTAESVFDRLVKVLDTNCGYVDEEKAETVAKRIMCSGLIREEKPQKWEFLFKALDGTPRYSCPVCKELEWRKTNYCPNCGTKMREES